MTDPTETDDRLEYLRRLIAARIPEVTEADLAALADIAPTDAMLPVEIGEQILAVVEALDQKVDRLAEALGHGDGDDDERQ